MDTFNFITARGISDSSKKPVDKAETAKLQGLAYLGSCVKRTVTMNDIAQKTGLSAMTVSRVLAGKKWVSKSTQDRVLQVAKELDYRMNSLPRQLRTNRSELIGVIAPFSGFVTSYYFGLILCGMNHALDGTHYHLTFYDSTSGNLDTVAKCPELLSRRTG